MTPLDALKAGIKTALFTFLTGLLVAATGVLNEVNDYISKGDPINWGFLRASTFALLAALGVGAVNALIRYLQVAGPGLVGKVLAVPFGAVPAYPEKDTAKLVPPSDPPQA